MNKGRRQELKMLKYKRRLKIYNVVKEIALNNNSKVWYALRSHGAPCSCYLCSHDKYQRAKDKKSIRKDIEEGMMLYPPFKYLIDGYPFQEELRAFEEKYSDIDIDTHLLPDELYKAA